MAEKTSQTEKVASPFIGNAIAYFLVPALVSKGVIEKPADPELALAMGGAVVIWALLQARTFLSWLGGLIERIAD